MFKYYLKITTFKYYCIFLNIMGRAGKLSVADHMLLDPELKWPSPAATNP